MATPAKKTTPAKATSSSTLADPFGRNKEEGTPAVTTNPTDNAEVNKDTADSTSSTSDNDNPNDDMKGSLSDSQDKDNEENSKEDEDGGTKEDDDEPKDRNPAVQKSDEEKEQERDNTPNTVKGLTNEDGIYKDDVDTNRETGLSNSVVHATSYKTPDEMSTEPPRETAERYNITNEVSEADVKNPRVQIYSDTVIKQVPSGTHLHPDVAKSLHNYGIADRTTDSAQVKRSITETHDFADAAEHNDKL